MPGSYDFFDPAVREDPYPLFDRLREQDPVYQTDFGYWYVSRYADANALVRDARLEAGRGVADSFGLSEGPLHDVMSTWMMSLNGTAHTRVRRLISRAFTPRAVEALRPAIEARTAELVGAIVAKGGGDIVSELAFPLPIEVVRLLFGVAPDEWDREVVALFDPRRAAPGGFLEPMQRLVEYFGRVVPERRASPGDDMFSAMVRPDDDGDSLGDRELIANAILLVTAGFETTMGLITLAVLTLLRHPPQLALLRTRPDLVTNAVDEVLRFEPAALSTTRYTPVELEVAGRRIPAGSNILFSVIAANRDPERYRDPGAFDVARDDIRPLTFGGGAHVCIGAALARLEAEVAITTLLARTSSITLAEEALTWQATNPTVRRPERLVVACTA